MTQARSIVEVVYEKLGGNRILGSEIASEADLARVVSARIPLLAVASLQNAGFSEREIDQFVIPARTRRHRRERKEPLTVEESDRLVRLARIQALAEDVFADPDKANKWLRQGLPIAHGQTPLALARTEAGARLVEQILGKLDWGAAA